MIINQSKLDLEDVIHYRVPATKDKVLCRNGSYHVYWTDLLVEVTCPECKRKLARRKA